MLLHVILCSDLVSIEKVISYKNSFLQALHIYLPALIGNNIFLHCHACNISNQNRFSGPRSLAVRLTSAVV
jgi:hypothetical protein